MKKGLVNYGIAMLATLAVLLALISPVGRRAAGPSRPASSRSHVLPSRHRSPCRTDFGDLDVCPQRRLSFDLVASNQFDFQEVMDVDNEEESTPAFLPALPSFGLRPSPRPDAIRKLNSPAISGAPVPLRC